MPLISVLMPVFNEEKYLLRQLTATEFPISTFPIGLNRIAPDAIQEDKCKQCNQNPKSPEGVQFQKKQIALITFKSEF
jgi:hypothetical protein